MARLANRLPDNVPGEFYVDSSCIDCDTCRQVAPALETKAREHLVACHYAAKEAAAA